MSAATYKLVLSVPCSMCSEIALNDATWGGNIFSKCQRSCTTFLRFDAVAVTCAAVYLDSPAGGSRRAQICSVHACRAIINVTF